MEELAYLSLHVSKENDRGPKFMEAALAGIAEIFKDTPAEIGFEMAVQKKFLNFIVAVPTEFKDLILGQLLGQYPQLEIEATQDYALVLRDEQFVGTDLVLEKSDYYPIQTYPNLEIDPLTNISGVFAGFREDERVWIQIVIRAVNKDALGFKIFQFARKSSKRLIKVSPEYTKTTEEIEAQKGSRPLFRSKIRLVCLGPDHERTKLQLQAIVSSFKNFTKQGFNGFKAGRPRNDPGFLNDYQLRILSGKTYLLNSEELASVYHLPSKGAEIAQVVETKAKRAQPPANLPKDDDTDQKIVSIFGETTFRNEKIRFGIKREDRSRHTYLIGKTGMGKSKLLELLILEDFKQGKGVAFLDPHGDQAEEILRYIPKDRLYDTIYFNPADTGYPIGFNPMETVQEFEYKQNVVTGFIGIFKKLFGWNWNERLEHVLRYTTLALLDYPNSTVLGITRMLTDNLFRQEVISKIQDPLVKKFWTTEFSSWSDQFSQEAIVPVINKVGQFIASPLIRNIVGQPKSVLNLSEIMNNEKILICNLAAGKLGEENSALLGSMLITKIWQAALERAATPENERKDFYLYVDEFQNFATNAFGNILSEARKYKLCLTVAHQYMKQLPEEVRSTIFGNVGSIVSFRVGGEDAAILEKEFTPEFSANDLMNLDMREIYIKMAINGQTAPPFSAKTISLPTVDEDYSQDVIDFSRRKWARPKAEVEREIEEFERKEFKGATAEIEIQKTDEKPKFTEPLV